jgi:ATP-dependent 26S proteasome regulatory subunit
LASLLPEDDAGEALPTRALWFIGPRGSGLLPMAAQVAALLGRGALSVRVEPWLHAAKRPDPGELLREALLGRRALMLDFCELDDARLMERDPRTDALDLLRALERLCGEFGVPLFLLSHHPLKFLRLHMSDAEPVQIDYPSPARRSALWEQGLTQAGMEVPEAPELRRLAHTFVFAQEDIARVVKHAERVQRARGTPAQLGDIEDICRDDLDVRLQGLTRRVRQPATMQDLVLSEEQREGIEELIAYARFRDMLFEDWGFGAHYKSGKGVHCLFTGPPGTGKTMAASIVANALDLPLYRIELSQVVDRYVGETEKRLEQIFDEASRCPCALLFDEADSLFGKRTEVRSSNDRYANLEVNYLLQRMEDFEGITVLTTNLETSLDQAFLRRIRFSVRFPEPDRALSRELWRKLLPREAELEGSIDFDRLAGRFEMSGGHIKNAILRAALKAMRDKRGIAQADLEQAAVIEYTKLGKLVPSANLKPRT